MTAEDKIVEAKISGMKNKKNSLLLMEDISKSFPGTKALDNVSFELSSEGEIHALVGENGAGKSTLVKILHGALARDTGDIYLRGNPYKATNVQQSQKTGLAFIPQTSNLIGCLSVKENLFLGQEFRKGRVLERIDWRTSRERANELLDRVGLKINPDRKIEELEVAEQQLVEIAKVLGMNAKIVTMDEPTSSLTEEEAERLFDIIRGLKKEAVSIIFVSHKLDEIFSISDKITVLRNGLYVGTKKTSDTDRNEIVKMMTGREEAEKYTAGRRTHGSVIFKASGINTYGMVRDVSFEMREGETLSIAGLLGSGRTELLETLCGYSDLKSGSLEVAGKPFRINNPKGALSLGIGYISEDRHRKGLMLNQSVKENVGAASMRDDMRFGLINVKVQIEKIKKFIGKLGIICSGIHQLVENLSGGNQQKVLLARYLKAGLRVLLLNEPTRGIDVGAKTEIYKLINDFKKDGGSVLMVSSELPEILAVSDRIMVMHDGRVTGLFTQEEATKEKLMHAMTG
jgi:ribose transport system ATP-binding protein